MAIQNEPSRISTPFADAGTKNVIPETMAQPSATAAASWQAGFPTVCSLPLSAGGIPPARNDFNGLFNQMTQIERFLQDGGIFAWDASTDYGANRLVLGSDGKLYWSVAQSGPNTGAGAVDPTTDSGTYWGQLPVTATEAAEASYSSVAGGFVSWSNTIDYAVSQIVLGSDGLVYMAKAASGPNAGGAQNPTTDNDTYWTAFKTYTMAPVDNSKNVATTEWVNKWFDFYRPKADYYVDPVNGNDSNNGETLSTPKKTVSNTLATISYQYFRNATITIHLASGNYAEALYNSISSSTINFIGPSSGGVASFTSGGFAFASTYTVLGGRIQFTGTVNVGRNSILYMNPGLYLNFNDLGNTADSISCSSGGRLTMGFSSSINSSTIEYTGTNSFSNATIVTFTGGMVDINASKLTFSGSVTGKRYNCTFCSGINGTGSQTKIPGTVNGTIDSTSFYS